ncbi:hypothetical protein [Parendozoicomonas sp. Alg238-R29]|uniref:hypothetical protein n=1 Tax=Parendozoicomonas sp. Alg238-R29 TaxID=2993446 RepID=UPI00248D5CB7|nr:hypothetical protein [Parendozoicomonas sp. Alg238-R29]
MIYKIQPVPKEYQLFILEADDVEDILGEDCLIYMDSRPTRYLSEWSPIPVHFYDEYQGGLPKKSIPDIISNQLGKLFLNQKAYEVLHPLFKEYGEFLPVTFEDQPAYIFNPLVIAEDLDALDQENTTFDEWDGLKAPAFNKSRLQDIPILRTKIDSYRGIYCSQNVKEVITSHGLLGLSFTEDLSDVPPPQ